MDNTRKVFIYAKRNLTATKVDEKFDHVFNNLKCAGEVNLGFIFILRKIEDEWKIQNFLGTRELYPVGLVQTCVHQAQRGEIKSISQQNWYHRVLK